MPHALLTCRPEQTGTKWTVPPGDAVGVRARVPNETPASSLIELCLKDELLSLSRSSRRDRKVTEFPQEVAREELAVDEERLARKRLTPPLVGNGSKGLTDPDLVERVSSRACLTERIPRVPSHVVTSECRRSSKFALSIRRAHQRITATPQMGHARLRHHQKLGTDVSESTSGNRPCHASPAFRWVPTSWPTTIGSGEALVDTISDPSGTPGTPDYLHRLV